MLPRTEAFRKPGKYIFFAVFFIFTSGLNAQTRYEFPLGDFWALDAGIGMSGILVDGLSFQAVIDPKLWLSPRLMVGSRMGINYSTEDDRDNLLAFEGQVYLRWNFLHLGRQENPVNVFLQGGLGLVSVYRGSGANPFNDVTRTRGSLMFDGAAGVTIPLSSRWHIEPSARAGYPHIFGISLTAGYKFPLPQATRNLRAEPRVEYVEVARTVPASELVSRVMISAIEFILFGPDIGIYNVGIDWDAQQLNELVLDYTARALLENPNYRVRIEGHANPYTINHSEINELMTLSAMRSEVVAEQLRGRGVPDDQIVVISFGGTRTVTNEWDIRNRNRRVEMILIQVGAE
ncbi:MAG: OmpA family protein [Treponema sp.]|nr:OmpA family protein [Treponema sp.]